MKKFLRSATITYLVFASVGVNAQCGAGYTSSLLNWDKLDYYYNSGSNVAPYGFSGGNYISNAMEQTQKFAIGRNYVQIATSAAGMVDGENATHTGDIIPGEDAQFTPSAVNQTITLTFGTEVQNLVFTLYDVDLLQRIDFNAKNAAGVDQNIGVTTYASTILTVNNNNATNARISASNTAAANNSNTGSATITVGTCKTFTITFSTLGSDPVLWLSDISACVLGSFPNNYQQTGNNQPLQGPFVNQPDYFLVTPDNNGAYMVDPATGNAKRLFTDPAKTYINSFAYDPYNHLLYYISENVSVNANDKELKRYDCTTGTITSLVADIQATLGIPIMGSGVESAGAAFYDGALYIGIEGGKFDPDGNGGTVNDRTRETIFWRIDFDASLNPVSAYQVFALDAYVNASNTSIHDFGDFIIRNGVLYDFNTARNGTNYANSTYQQFDMTTGAATIYTNPGTTEWNGQAGMGWSGQLYYFRNTGGGNSGVGTYNGAGINGAPVNITVIDGTGAWPGGSGDASENFRPQVDFGDAPASYDPNPASPAAHDQIANLRLGSNLDKEWQSKGHTALANSDAFDDALPYVTTYNPQTNGNYLTFANVFNNTGANATVCAWLDFDGDGVFQSSEGISVTVPSSASVQNIALFFTLHSSTLAHGTYTYLRIRIASAANGMTTANPTGYFPSGEVEDYRVPVNSYPLAVQQMDFNAQLTATRTVKLTWTSVDETNLAHYIVERSKNNTDWEIVDYRAPKNNSGTTTYEVIDRKPLQGISYYRLKMIETNDKANISEVRKIDNKAGSLSVRIAPNPASEKSFINVTAAAALSNEATMEVINSQGMIVHQEKVRINAGNNSFAVPIAKFSNGRYLVRIVTDEGSFTNTLIIRK
jgi:hypothetical protein